MKIVMRVARNDVHDLRSGGRIQLVADRASFRKAVPGGRTAEVFLFFTEDAPMLEYPHDKESMQAQHYVLTLAPISEDEAAALVASDAE